MAGVADKRRGLGTAEVLALIASASPAPHASKHISGGDDEISGEALAVAYAAGSYSPLAATLLGHLTAIDKVVPDAAQFVFVASKDDLPTPAAGVITLADAVTYFITTEVDLLGDRLVAGLNTVIMGGSSENCGLKSTGLVGTALITSTCSLPMRHLFITADVALDLDGSATPGAALDWYGVNFVNCATIGTIANYTNVLISSSAFLSSGQLTFDGTIATVGISATLVQVAASAIGLKLAPTLVITRRFRVIYSAVIAPTGTTGISVGDRAATFGVNETFILDTVAFSDAGTFLDGIDHTNNEALFINCAGVDNSGNAGQYVMNGNALVTSLTLQNTFYKVQGVTSVGGIAEKFDVTTVSNRAKYVGALSAPFKISVIASYTDGNFQDIALRVAKNGVTIPASEAVNSTGGGGRAEGASLQAVVLLEENDYIEVWAANKTSAGSSLTVTDLNVIVEQIQ